MKITVLLSNGEALTYYGEMKITGGALEIKTENPQAGIIVLPLAYVEGYRKEGADVQTEIRQRTDFTATPGRTPECRNCEDYAVQSCDGCTGYKGGKEGGNNGRL